MTRLIRQLPTRGSAWLGALLLVSGGVPSALAAPASPAAAAPPSDPTSWREADAVDYCREVTSAAASESALLRWPRLYSRFGLMRGSPLDADAVGSARRDLLWNLQAGIDVSPVRIHDAALTDRRARAECRRYAAELAFQELTLGLELEAVRALPARAAALRARLPEAEQRLAQSAAELRASRVSAPGHAATRRRVDGLRRALAQAELDLASMPEPGPRPARASAGVFESLRVAEARSAALSSQQRRLEAFAVSLRAGYDEVFGVAQDVPLFAFLSLQLSPGALWQASRDAESERAHQRRVERRIEQAQTELSTRVTRQLAVLERRVKELDGDIGDAHAQYAELERVGTPAALDFMEDLWFEAAALEADRAYLGALRDALRGWRRDLVEARPR